MSLRRPFGIRARAQAIFLPLLALPVLLTGCLRVFDPLPAPMVDATVPPDMAIPPTPVDGGGTMTVGGYLPDLSSNEDDGGQVSGRSVFNANVLPILQAHNCGGCHDGANPSAPVFLKAPEYDSLRAYTTTAGTGFIVRNPNDSLLVTKGPHNAATWFSDVEKLFVVDWLTIEAMALPPDASTTVFTVPQTMVDGYNAIPLDPLGSDFLGATVTFNAAVSGSGVKITMLVAHATGPSGLQIVHPEFVGVKNGIEYPDPVDNFDGVDLQIPNATSAPIPPGLVILTNVAEGEQVSIAFASLTRYDGVMLVGGCKDVSDFTAIVEPAVAGAGCPMCHDGTNATAKAALDMSQLTTLTAMAQASACAQMLSRIDTTTPANSDIFIVTDPMTTSNHKLRFTFATEQAFMTFMTTVTTPWITQEK